MGRAITPLFAAMLIALFVVPAPASPTLRTLWSIDTASSVQFIWFSQELVLQSAQTAENGGYLNVVQAMNSSETLWTYSSFGPVMTFTTAVTFENVHKLAFLLENNLQPPNVTAIVPSTGEVVWSSASAFPTATVPLLQTSFDGRSLYLFTVSSDGVTQLTAFDAATGETLFTRGEGNVAVNVTQCGPSRVPCVVEFLSNGSVVFWDGRTGATLTNSTLAFPSAANSVFAWLIPLSTDMMLFGLPGAVFGINTSNYTLAWSAEPQGSTFLAFAQPYRVGDAERIAAVVMGRTIIAGFDAATGSTLWSASVTSICPFSAPAPGRAHRFDQFSLGPFPSDLYGGGLFSFTAACSYTTSNDLLIVGAMSAANGALKWWRYLSQAPPAYPLLPLGRKTFMVYSSLNSQEEFYAGDSANSFAAYPSSGPVSFLVAAAANGTAFLQYYSIQPSFAVVEVAGL